MRKGGGSKLTWTRNMVSFAEYCLQRDMTYDEVAQAMRRKFGVERISSEMVRYQKRRGTINPKHTDDFSDQEYDIEDDKIINSDGEDEEMSFNEDGNNATLEYKSTENPKIFTYQATR